MLAFVYFIPVIGIVTTIIVYLLIDRGAGEYIGNLTARVEYINNIAYLEFIKDLLEFLKEGEIGTILGALESEDDPKKAESTIFGKYEEIMKQVAPIRRSLNKIEETNSQLSKIKTEISLLPVLTVIYGGGGTSIVMGIIIWIMRAQSTHVGNLILQYFLGSTVVFAIFITVIWADALKNERHIQFTLDIDK